MCRILAFASAAPRTFVDTVGAASCAEFQRLARLHGDGWGAMWLAPGLGGTSLRRFRSGHGGLLDEDLTTALGAPAAYAGVAHLRMASVGTVDVRNTHPFLDGSVGLVHNGSITPVRRLREMLDPLAATRVAGSTDSEAYLALVAARVRAGASLPEAVWEVVPRIRAAFPATSLNAVLLDKRHFVVVHSWAGAVVPVEEFHGRLVPGETMPPHHDADYYRLGRRRLPDGTVVFASSGLEADTWEEVPPESVTVLDLRTMAESVHELAGSESSAA
jgi:glutamine amidotransferase